MNRTIISIREAITVPELWGDIPRKYDPDKLYPNRDNSNQFPEEKATIPERGAGKPDWVKVERDLHLKYEVPAFDDANGIFVLVNGKMPHILGNSAQFSGTLESIGIGNVFHLSHDLLGAIRKFVYQELPKADKFLPEVLNAIYNDTVLSVGQNVPIRSIYKYLQNAFPKEFAVAMRGRKLNPEQIEETISEQHKLYKTASLFKNVIKTAQMKFKKNDVVSFDLRRMDEETIAALKKYDNEIEYHNKVVFFGQKDATRSTVVIKTDKGVLKAISVPTKFLTPFKQGQDNIDEMMEEQRELHGEDDGNEEQTEGTQILYNKLHANKKLNNKEIAEVFSQGIFDNMDETEFIQILHGVNGKDLYAFYEKNKQHIDKETFAKFIVLKVLKRAKLDAEEIDQALKTFTPDQIKENPTLATASIYYKTKNQLPMQPWEIKFLLENNKFNEKRFGENKEAFTNYYNEALTENKLHELNPQFKRIIMEDKKEYERPFSTEEQQDPVYQALYVKPRMKI